MLEKNELLLKMYKKNKIKEYPKEIEIEQIGEKNIKAKLKRIDHKSRQTECGVYLTEYGFNWYMTLETIWRLTENSLKELIKLNETARNDERM